MSRQTSNLGLILYDPSEDKDVKVRDVINKVLGFTDSNTIKIDTKTKDIDTNIKTLHDSIIGTDGNVVFYNKQEVFLAVHPVGSIFLSTSDVEPAELYGGTWECIEDKFIMGASDSYPVGTTGGSATHTQTVAELASHNHSGATGSAGSHSHSGSTGDAGGHNHTVSSAAVTKYGITTLIGEGTTEYGFQSNSSTPTTSWSGNHTHTVSISSAGAHTHTVSIGSTGSNQPMNILNPYYAVNIWRRIK